MTDINYILDLQNHGGLLDMFKYPAGEWQVRLTELGANTLPEDITLVSRITSADEFVKTSLAVDALNGAGHSITLYLPYLPYGRADRRFTAGDCHGLGWFMEAVGGLSWFRLLSLDVHKHTPDMRWLQDLSPSTYIRRAVTEFAQGRLINVLFPDDGAARRYTGLGDLGNSIWSFAKKERDPKTGRLFGFTLPADLQPLPTLIIDDICDGGGTFVGLGDELDKVGITEKALYVTHGIFSQGTHRLTERFNRVFCTDSFPAADLRKNAKVTVFDCLEALSDNE